jgi:predicted class III extradiol MEMO1 family dioxygenase
MNEVAARDRARLERVVDGDADGFWDALHERGRDDLNWCGSAPLYTFLRAHPGVRGRILDYDQWNIDEQSVVSFAALAFSR